MRRMFRPLSCLIAAAVAVSPPSVIPVAPPVRPGAVVSMGAASQMPGTAAVAATSATAPRLRAGPAQLPTKAGVRQADDQPTEILGSASWPTAATHSEASLLHIPMTADGSSADAGPRDVHASTLGAWMLSLSSLLLAAVAATFRKRQRAEAPASLMTELPSASAFAAEPQRFAVAPYSGQAAGIRNGPLLAGPQPFAGLQHWNDRKESPAARTIRAAKGGEGKAPIVVIAGPPAAGKGTQCEKIKEKFGYVHISTGDILRANVKEKTELGLKAEEYMTAGKLVPSELIVDLVKDRLAKPDIAEKGCLLDGFPRAPDQAQAMVDAGIGVDKFILIEVPDDDLVERGCGRRLDPETGDIYHLKFKPPPDVIVDRLVHRSDDQEEAIRKRLAIYHEQVNGILPFFEKVVAKIDGLPKPAVVTEAVFAALE